MTTRTQLIMQARKAGHGRPCPVERGDVSAEGLARFHAWLVALTAAETGANIIPEHAESEHPDLQICRPADKEAL
jgi:hypothetical protein